MNTVPRGQIFRASPFWRANLFCALVAGIIGFTALQIWDMRSGEPKTISALFGTIAVGTLILYFPGNLSVLWPYAVRVEPSRITLFGPFKRIIVPASEIGEIENSLVWQGDVVHLLKPRAALTQFIIPWYFGSERRALIEAVRHVAQASGAD